MSSESWWAAGTILQVSDGATPEVFTAVAEVVDVHPPHETKDSIEVTHHGSTSKYREYIPGLKDGGTLPLDVNWLLTNATHNKSTGLRKVFEGDSNVNMRLVLPDSLGTISFAGHITDWNPQTPLPSQGKLSISIKISGPVVYPW